MASRMILIETQLLNAFNYTQKRITQLWRETIFNISTDEANKKMDHLRIHSLRTKQEDNFARLAVRG